MEQTSPTRRLTTVLASDVVGYSKMAARDEERAVGLLKHRFETISTFVKNHEGRVFNTAGDALLAEFASPVEAVRCALEIQEAMQTANHLVDEADRLQLRIGINLGDVIVNGSDLLGDGVNVAARLESLAPAGGICVSSNVYEQLIGKLTLGAEDLGEQHVKNIPRPIRAYRLKPEGAPPVGAGGALWALAAAGLRRRVVVPVLGVVVVAGVAVVAARWPGPDTSQASAARPAPRQLVPEDVPFLDDGLKEMIRAQYLPALPSKALAIADGINLAFAVTQRVDEATAQKEALEGCNRDLQRRAPLPSHITCRLYAVGNDVVWTNRPPPMPAQPWVAATRPMPTMKVQPESIPLISAAGRRVISEAYPTTAPIKAIAIGRGGAWHFVGTRASDFAAMRSALEACGRTSERPCFIFALGDEVVVHVPRIARIVDVMVPDDLVGISDSDRHRIDALYLPDGSWRALAIAGNGRIGLGLRQPDEQQAIDQAVRECQQAGGLQCALTAVGPFKVTMP